jgi:hypothetical protein
MKKFLDTDHAVLKPLWVRLAVVAVAAGWGLFEFATGSPFWGVLFLGLAAYAVWSFFFDFNPDGGPDAP